VYKDADADYVVAKVGLRPSVMGGDLLGYSPYFQKHSPKKDDEIARLIADYLSGQMITLSWHWGSPFGGLDTKEKPWWRAFYTDSTTFDVSKAVIPGTPEHDAAISDLDVIAIQLKRLQDAHVPVLWRPLHEAQGAWFWWGAKGPAPFKALWAMLYDRLVHVDGIHNLIWVFTSGDDPAWYPGDAMVDIVGIDAYPKNMHDAENSLWVELQQQFDGRKPLAILEFGGVPDIPRMQHLGEYWLYAVSWSDKLGPAKNDPADLVRIYTNPGVSALPTAATPPPAAAPATSAPSQRMQ
jgi:mannan endo-1,4-beta-mannosidase